MLVRKLDVAREVAGIPFIITSGYRCGVHNKSVGGVNNSPHTKGLAADIAVTSGFNRFRIVQGLIVAGFRRIGIGHTFIHCDIALDRPNNLWLYLPDADRQG